MNTLYYGDCLEIMQEMPIKGIDLIYLDPPFNSKKEYNSIYRDETGRPLPQQVRAFNDQWTLDKKAEEAIKTMPILIRETGLDDEIATFWRIWVNALRKTQPDLLAYLTYMVQRFLVMRTLLSDTGSIYLHCDPTASHYIKVMMDGIFGHRNFRNEIIWRRTGAHGGAKRWGPIHDVLLFYTKGNKYTWNRVCQDYDASYLDNFYKFKDEHGRYRLVSLEGSGTRQGDSGKPWKKVNPSDKGRHWALPGKQAFPEWFSLPEGYGKMTVQDKLDSLDDSGMIRWPPRGSVPQVKRYLSVSEGNPVQDIIWDIRAISSKAEERLGYSTQKPLALLERIIKASSNEGDKILDPFCGCATTIEAAHTLNREWIGIDIASFAIKRVARDRLKDRLGLIAGKDFKIEGIPGTLEDAKELWEKDKFVFQEWSISQVDGFPTNKKTGDGGIDGRIYFEAPGEDDLQSMVLEVKGGKHVSIKDLRALHSVLERDDAQMAGLIVMYPLGDRQLKNFQRLMMEAGDLHVFGRPFPRMQILTVQEILDGVRFDIPYPVDKRSNQGILLSSK